MYAGLLCPKATETLDARQSKDTVDNIRLKFICDASLKIREQIFAEAYAPPLAPKARPSQRLWLCVAGASKLPAGRDCSTNNSVNNRDFRDILARLTGRQRGDRNPLRDK
jgi:hypothetical protein